MRRLFRKGKKLRSRRASCSSISNPVFTLAAGPHAVSAHIVAPTVSRQETPEIHYLLTVIFLEDKIFVRSIRYET